MEFSPRAFRMTLIGWPTHLVAFWNNCDQLPLSVTSCSEDCPHTPTARCTGPAAVPAPWEAVTEGWTVVAWGLLPLVGPLFYFPQDSECGLQCGQPTWENRSVLMGRTSALLCWTQRTPDSACWGEPWPSDCLRQSIRHRIWAPSPPGPVPAPCTPHMPPIPTTNSHFSGLSAA